MSDIETMNKAFAQAVLNGSSTIMVSFPHRAGKSTIHRCISEFMKSNKPIIAWDEAAQVEIDTCQPAVSEEDRNLGESRLRQIAAAHLRHIRPITYDEGSDWFKAIESELAGGASAKEKAFNEAMMDSMNANWQAHSYDSAWKGKSK